jgi:superfamily II DNA/RNA helicase
MNSFEIMGIKHPLTHCLNIQGIKKPTPIQTKTIPMIMSGSDLIVQAQTGSGKTLAFLLPIFQSLIADSQSLQGLIIAPTRELALQITSEAKKLNSEGNWKILAVYGGQDINAQLHKLKGSVDLVIATPGRLLDHLRRKTLSIDHLKFLVLDEADQMLQFGFKNEIEYIIKLTNADRQLLCFSATLDSKVKKLAYRFMNHPEEVLMKEDKVPLNLIRQKVVLATDRWKQEALLKELDQTNPFLGIIFCRTKRRADKLENEMSLKKYACNKLHGDMTQRAREHVMKSFRDAKFQYLIATDVAARGLDISNVTHIYNFDMPESVEGYIHRIGRTGRLDQKGMAITFATSKDMPLLAEIEKSIGIKLSKTQHEHQHQHQVDRRKRK